MSSQVLFVLPIVCGDAHLVICSEIPGLKDGTPELLRCSPLCGPEEERFSRQ